MQRFSIIATVLLVIVVCLPQEATAHSWKTSKGNVVKHAHYDDLGTGTSANDDPASGHDGKPGGDHPNKKKFPDAKFDDKLLKKLKADLEKFFKRKFPTEWNAGKIKQIHGASYSTNCYGTDLEWPGSPEGGAWVEDPTQVAKVISDDWKPLPAGTPATTTDGMILVYRAHNKDTGPITHVANITKVDSSGNPTEVHSKFGAMASFKHPPNTVPTSYMHGGGGWKIYQPK